MKENRSKIINALGKPLAVAAVVLHKAAHPHLPTCVAVHVKRRHVEMTCGVIVMAIGVTITKMGPEVGLLHFACDLFGFSVHGVGLVPFAKLAEGLLAAE